MTDRTEHARPPRQARPAPKNWQFAAWYGLAIMVLISMAGNSLFQIMALVTEPLKHDLSLSDTQIGTLRGIAISLVSAVASYPIAWLADRIDRRLIFAACILIWSLAMAGMGFATSFPMLFALGVGIAFGEAVLGPVTFAIIPELFPAERRMLANSIFFVAQLLGVSVGLAFGAWLVGTISHSHEMLPASLRLLAPWRVTFIAAALPSVVLIPFVLAMRLNRTAPHVALPEQQSEEGVWSFFSKHRWTLAPLFVGFGLIGAANFIPYVWMVPILMRNFGESQAAVGAQLSQTFAIGSISGVIVANLAARVLTKRNADTAPVRVAQLGTILAALASSCYLFAQSATQYYIIAAVQMAASFGGLVLSPTVTQNITPARIRARVIAIGGLVYTVFGAISPVLVGAVSDSFGAGPRALIHAVLLVTLPAFALGVVSLQLGLRTLSATLEAVRNEE